MGPSAVLDVVDALWQVDSGRNRWLEELVGTASTYAPAEIEAAAYSFRTDGEQIQLTGWRGDDGLSSIPMSLLRELTMTQMMETYGLDAGGQCLKLVNGMPVPEIDLSAGRFNGGHMPRVLSDEYRGLGLDEAVVLLVNDVGGEHFKLVLPLACRPQDPNPLHRHRQVLDRWRPVTRHLDRALRVRHAVENGFVAAEVDENGRGHFADPEQRDAIQRAVEREKWYRRHLSRDDLPGSMTAWDRLLAGEFSIVRTRTASGATRFLAVENDPTDGGVRRLTHRERDIVQRVAAGESNKAVALDLELQPSSVANILRRAMTKLGVQERLHLARLVRVLGSRHES